MAASTGVVNVVMEGDEMEMTQKELQQWIRENVKSELVDQDVLKRCHLLQSLLERREQQAATFLQLCESVAECEAVMKRLYSLLGWEYRDTDSDDEKMGSPYCINIDDDDDDAIDCDDIPQSPYEAVPPEAQAPSSLTTNGPTPQSQQRQDSKTLDTDKGKKPQREEGSSAPHLMKDAVVVLTKLREHTRRSSLRPPTIPLYSSEGESSSYDSDTRWEPKDESSDSDCSNFSSEIKSNKKRGTHQKTGKLRMDDTTKAKQTATVQKPTKEQTCALVVYSLSQDNANQPTEPPSGLQEEEITVDMKVLARRRPLNWQWGKIREIITKVDGRVKYKVDFDVKGRCLLSAHHIAFDHIPKVEQLYIGARVAAKYQEANQSRFCSGVLGELPSRKNDMRFLVFFDDHTPSYVGLPLLHLVCRPLKNILEDILDSAHRNFIKEYLKAWPHPSMTQCKAGQIIHVEFKGVQKRCEVQQVDCSLVHVVFQDDQHKEWIYRGSMRLEHIANMGKLLEEKEEHKDKPASKPTVTV